MLEKYKEMMTEWKHKIEDGKLAPECDMFCSQILILMWGLSLICSRKIRNLAQGSQNNTKLSKASDTQIIKTDHKLSLICTKTRELPGTRTAHCTEKLIKCRKIATKALKNVLQPWENPLYSHKNSKIWQNETQNDDKYQWTWRNDDGRQKQKSIKFSERKHCKLMNKSDRLYPKI